MVVEPTHLKNMLVKLDHFPTDRDEHKKSLKPPTSLGCKNHGKALPKPHLAQAPRAPHRQRHLVELSPHQTGEALVNRNSTGPKKGTVFERIFETYICIDIFYFLCTFNSKFVCLFVCMFV